MNGESEEFAKVKRKGKWNKRHRGQNDPSNHVMEICDRGQVYEVDSHDVGEFEVEYRDAREALSTVIHQPDYSVDTNWYGMINCWLCRSCECELVVIHTCKQTYYIPIQYFPAVCPQCQTIYEVSHGSHE